MGKDRGEKFAEPIADKVLTQSHQEAPPMNDRIDRRPANLAALRQGLKELAAATTKEKPVQGPVEDVDGGIRRSRRLPRRCSIPTSSADLRQEIA